MLVFDMWFGKSQRDCGQDDKSMELHYGTEIVGDCEVLSEGSESVERV
jgi:hypothetical protein